MAATSADAPPPPGGVLRGDGLDLVELELHLRLIDVLANKGKYFERLTILASTHQISRRFRQQQAADQIKFGIIIVSTLPLLVLYPFLQKYFNKGVMLGAVKG